MNVYDFDKTIFDGDCEDYFFAWFFRKHHWPLYHFNYHFHELLFKCGLMSKTQSREKEYRFLRKVEDLDSVLEQYWNIHARHMMAWYLAIKEPTDVIATGSPRFLMEPIVERLGLTRLVATDMDRHTGKINGKFAVKQYKLQAFEEQFDTSEIDNFYSDSFDDNFLAQHARHAYAVHDGDTRTLWNDFFRSKLRYPSLRPPSP